MNPRMQFPLVYHVRTPDGWRWFKPIIEGDKVTVIDHGRVREYPGGKLYVRYWENGRRKFEPVKKAHWYPYVRKALAVRLAQESAASGTSGGHKRLTEAVEAYKRDLRGQNKLPMEISAEFALRDWKAWPRPTREDVIEWLDRLRKSGLSERTIGNRYIVLKHFLKFHKVTIPDLPKVRVPKKKVYVVDDEAVTALLAACDPYTRVLVEMGRQLGLRKRELMFAAWSDISWSTAEFTVREKPDLGFTIKNRKERIQQMAPNLVSLLRSWQQESTGGTTGRLILGTKTGKPNYSLLNKLKSACVKAKLDPKKFTLHGLRKKYGSMLHNNGTPLATVSAMLDHASIATTERYLGIEGSKEQAAHVTRVFG